MVLLLTGQRPEEEVVVAEVILALLAAFVRAAAAGRTVGGGAARLVGPPAPGGGVSGRGHASSEPNHADAPVSGRGGRLGLDVQVLVAGEVVQVRVLTQVPETRRERRKHTGPRRDGRGSERRYELTPCVRALSAAGSGSAVAASSSPTRDQKLQTRTGRTCR